MGAIIAQIGGRLIDARSDPYPSDPLDTDLGQRPSNPARGTTAVMLYGIDHMGAGDVDCGEGD
ncbi:hypothetical protein [Burkholderia sp. PU8-34]